METRQKITVRLQIATALDCPQTMLSPLHNYLHPFGAIHEAVTVDLPVSSSDIRSALAAGWRPEEIPEAVLAYIYQRGLYGCRGRRKLNVVKA